MKRGLILLLTTMLAVLLIGCGGQSAMSLSMHKNVNYLNSLR